MEKLELKHLAPYLPYELKVYSKQETIFYLNTFSNMKGRGIESRDVYSCLDNQYKPILRPLSDLTKKEYKNSFYGNPLDYKIDELPYKVFIKLLELHFDVFGLIEKGLAIDINKLAKTK